MLEEHSQSRNPFSIAELETLKTTIEEYDFDSHWSCYTDLLFVDNIDRIQAHFEMIRTPSDIIANRTEFTLLLECISMTLSRCFYLGPISMKAKKDISWLFEKIYIPMLKVEETL
ncbi:hypothetical protein ADUPG1_006127, partial [Aduncisulcus paluster]